MAAPLVDRSTGDTIPAADHNDVKDYIEDGTYRVNTLSLNIQGTGEVINSSGEWTGPTMDETVGGTGKSAYTQGDILYATNSVTLAKLPKGLAGQTLSMNGGATAPVWASPTSGGGIFGEVRMFALSMSGAVTKASLQSAGWAICDGTTPVSQGITSPTITTTPNMQDKFVSMSNDETSGTTGGSATIAHTHAFTVPTSGSGPSGKIMGGNTTSQYYTPAGTTGGASVTENRPPYYEVVYFMKVKAV